MKPEDLSTTELTASELARIDAICLDFESSLRSGESPSIEKLVARHGGSRAALLQHELELVQQEILQQDQPGSVWSVQSEQTPSHRMDDTIAASPIVAGTGVKMPVPGTRIGPYVIASEIGRGGMGVVFSAVDTRLDRRVAIKVLAFESSGRSSLSERFEREARAVAAISHPNIVELFDVGFSKGLPYAVMEFLDGEPLDQLLDRGGLEPLEVRRIGAQIAEALATAHESNVIHRDLKPQNVMMVPRGVGATSGIDASLDGRTESDTRIAKLFDFGLSRAPEISTSSEETAGGIVMGTPGYMSPEQVRGERVTPSADIFSLGCILYEAFYGERAFDGRTNAARFTATLDHEPAPDPHRRQTDPQLGAIIERCLNKDADKRPQSAAEIAKQLRVDGLTFPAVPSDCEQRHQTVTRRRLISLAAGGACGALLGAFFARGNANRLAGIHSLAVLAIVDKSSDAVEVTSSTAPVGDRELSRGEQLSSMLVHELTRLADVSVPKFRPLTAETQQEFREVGKLLDVDALLTGDLRTRREGTKDFLELDLQIISSKTGTQLWGNRRITESADDLLEMSNLATEIASVIGQRLTASAQEAAPPSVASFDCLVSGSTRSDPDSPQGLRMALSCFEKAHNADLVSAAPLAGIALTSITLAAQSDPKSSLELIEQARESAEEALAIDESSVEARLAMAMLDWQTVGRYREAELTFKELVMIEPNHWQVRHQRGLLQLAMGNVLDALVSLREASQLHTLSMSVKVDTARAHWFAGDAERAIQDAVRLSEQDDDSNLARGLLIDIFEQQERYDLAASIDSEIELSGESTAASYFAARRKRIQEIPYGAFGSALNDAIFKSRATGGLSDRDLADVIDLNSPMLRLLLSQHPSFASVKELPRAKEILPPSRI